MYSMLFIPSVIQHFTLVLFSWIASFKFRKAIFIQFVLVKSKHEEGKAQNGSDGSFHCPCAGV